VASERPEKDNAEEQRTQSFAERASRLTVDSPDKIGIFDSQLTAPDQRGNLRAASPGP
jgi:hypothetical protein